MNNLAKTSVIFDSNILYSKQLIVLVAYTILAILLNIAVFFDGIVAMEISWGKPEYSHGYMIPFISAYLLLKLLPSIHQVNPKFAWFGVIIVFLASSFYIVGELSGIYTVIQYAFIISMVGLCVSIVGINGGLVLSGALFYLFFMVPLPDFFYFNLSSQLQLISSTLGVLVLRLLDVSVFLEGNVIDLGTYKLQVVDACSGLRYLFPLMSFGFLVVCIYKAKFWQKAILFLSTIPITIAMNSFRIAVIGVTVDQWGIAAAEGFLHDFEGWVVFVACLGVLLLEVILLHKLAGQKGSPLDNIDVSMPNWNAVGSVLSNHKMKWGSPAVIALVPLAAVLILKLYITDRTEVIPDREPFTKFSLDQNQWSGKEVFLDREVEDELDVTDYSIVDFSHKVKGVSVNFYAAYYASQRKGASIHSPKSCIPGGGWRIESHEIKTLDSVMTAPGSKLRVNRVLIQKGESKNLVYYWFQQHGRVVTNEYIAKWYVFWDALMLNRTDGALLRLVANVPEGTSIKDVDAQMEALLVEITPQMSLHIPN